MSSSTPQSVVDARFCSPEKVQLAFFEESSRTKTVFMVADINGNIIFEVKCHLNRQVVYDHSSKTPVVSLHPKVLSLRGQWQVFAGDSSDTRHLLFTVRRSSTFQMKMKEHVFLAGNAEEEVCDFRIEGNYWKKDCTVYQGDSSTVVAQMSKRCEGAMGGSSLPQRQSFWVTVSPNVDYCFIAALVVVLVQQNRSETQI